MSFHPMGWHDPCLRLLTLRERIVVLVGEPGVGKTEFLLHASRELTGHAPEELQGGPKVDDVSLWGRYVLEGDRTVFRDGPLARALRSGAFFVLNDAGQVPFAQLSALLPFRHAERVVNPISQETFELPASFRIVLTTNRENASCRSSLMAMQSLLDGALLVDVPEPRLEEIGSVLARRFPAVSRERIERVLELIERFRGLSKDNDTGALRITIGLRAGLQMLTLLEAGFSEREAVPIAFVGKFLLDADSHQAADLAARLLEEKP